MLAGHILLVTFGLLTDGAVPGRDQPGLPRADGHPAVRMLIFLTAFEILVAFLQAYIFTILAAVYIDNSTVGHADEH